MPGGISLLEGEYVVFEKGHFRGMWFVSRIPGIFLAKSIKQEWDADLQSVHS